MTMTHLRPRALDASASGEPTQAARRLTRWSWTLLVGVALPASGVAALLWLVAGGFRLTMHALGSGLGAAAVTAVLIGGGLAALGYPIFAWRLATAAACSGQPRTSARAFFCALAASALLGSAVTFTAGWATHELTQDFTLGTPRLSKRIRKGTVACVLWGCAMLAWLPVRGAYRRMQGAHDLDARLPTDHLDRALWFLDDLTGEVRSAAAVPRVLEPSERVVYACGSYLLTDRRLIGVKDWKPLDTVSVPRDRIAELTWERDRDALQLVVHCSLHDGSRVSLETFELFSRDRELETVRSVLGLTAPDAPDELHAVAAAARGVCPAGVTAVASAPAGVLRWNYTRRAEVAGVALTATRLLQFDGSRVIRELAWSQAESLTLREVLGVDGPWRQFVLGVEARDGTRSRVKLTLHQDEASAFLRRLIQQVGVPVAFFPSAFAHV